MGDERRSNFRCPTLDERSAILRFKGRDQQVQLIDESSEGFAVRAADLRAKNGQQLQVRTHGGWCVAEVVHIERDGKETVLGLRRTEDLPDPREKVKNSVVILGAKSARGPAGHIGPGLTLGMVAVVGFWIYLAYSAYRLAP